MIARGPRPSTPDLLHNRFRVPRPLAWLVVALAAATGACDKVPLLAPTGSSITLSASSPTAALNSTVEITAVVQESAGTAPQNGTLVTFSTNLGTVEPREAQTRGGIARATLNTGGQSGTATITATSGTAKATGDASLKIAIGAAAAGSVVVSASPASVASTGGTATVTASALDEAGRKIPNVPISFSTTAGTLSANTASSDANGDATVTLTTNREATVTASVGSGTSAKTATTTVRVNTAPTLAFGALSPTSPTAGSPVSFTITPAANTTPTVTVDWGDGTATQNVGTLAGGAARTVSHTYASPGNYTATATATEQSSGETSTNTVPIAVGARPVNTIAITVTSGTTPALGTPTSFTTTPTTTTGAAATSNVRVDFGDGTAIDLGAVTGATTVLHTYATPGTYQVRATLTDIAGGTSTATTFVNLAYTISAFPNPVVVNTETTLTLNGATTGQTYVWDFGDGQTSGSTSSSSIAHRYTTTGTKNVRVVITNSGGTTTTVTGTVTVSAS